jgi:two-component system OmpR family sensor kinase
MFRSLAARLTATYVFAAIVLVVIVVAAVTAFSLSMFVTGTRESMDAVAGQVRVEYGSVMTRGRTLEAAAHDLAEHLARPDIRIGVFKVAGPHHWCPLAWSSEFGEGPMADGPRPIPERGPFGVDFPGDGCPRPIAGGPPFAAALADDRLRPGPFGPGPDRAFERSGGRPIPFGLNHFLRLESRTILIPRGKIMIFPDGRSLESAINAFWLAMIPVGLFAVGASWLLGRYITGQALRPLAQTTASLRRFGEGDFTPRPIVTTERNELGELARAYNAAASQVAAAFEERRQAERHMRQFIADAGHELRTPLTVVMGFIDVLRRRALGAESGRSDSMSLRIYETMLAESRRMRALIDKLILLARLENPLERELETVDLGEVAGQVATALQALESAPRIAVDVAGDAFVRGYEHELHDALTNLVENALKYAPGSPVDVRVRVAGGEALAEVIDRGPGIPADEQSRVFDRFYRGRDHGEAEGFGLGLAIAKRAVERTGGRIDLHSVLGEGSRFTLALPLAARGEAATAAV